MSFLGSSPIVSRPKRRIRASCLLAKFWGGTGKVLSELHAHSVETSGIADPHSSHDQIDFAIFPMSLFRRSRKSGTRLATRLQPWARNFKRVGVGEMAGFAAKIIQNVLH